MTLSAHQRAYWGSGPPDPITLRVQVLAELVDVYPSMLDRRVIKDRVFVDEYAWPGWVQTTLRWLEDRHLVERSTYMRGRWAATEAGLAAHALGTLDHLVEGPSSPGTLEAS